MIQSSAPGRAGIVGNPTDGYGGAVISCSLAQRASVVVTAADTTVLNVCGCEVTVNSPQDLEISAKARSDADVAKVVLAMLYGEVAIRPFRLVAKTDVPKCAGLAGSSALIVAILGSLLRHHQLVWSPYRIAEEARRIEFDRLQVVCGYQDQYMATVGRLNFLSFRGKEPPRSEETGRQGERPSRFATVERLSPPLAVPPLVLANTGVERNSGEVHRGPRQRWLDGEKAFVDGYKEIAALAVDAKEAMIDGDWKALGAAMNKNHEIQRKLGASGPDNERLIEAALSAGALGAKLAGAGHGGTIIALHPEPEVVEKRLLAERAVQVMRLEPSGGLTVEGEN